MDRRFPARPRGAGWLWLAVGIAALATFGWLVSPSGPGFDSSALAVNPTPVPTGDTDLEGLLFGGNPSTDWTDGNVCAGSRPPPGCYGDGQDVPHRALLKDLTSGQHYAIFPEHD